MSSWPDEIVCVPLGKIKGLHFLLQKRNIVACESVDMFAFSFFTSKMLMRASALFTVQM